MSKMELSIPDIGGVDAAEVIEMLVAVGDVVSADQPLVVLETGKATVEIPAEVAGTVQKLAVQVGSRVAEGDLVAVLEVQEGSEGHKGEPEKTLEHEASATIQQQVGTTDSSSAAVNNPPKAAPASDNRLTGSVYAGPAVRKMARELGVSLGEIAGTGPRGRVLKCDLQRYVRHRLDNIDSGMQSAGIPEVKSLDYAKFGTIEFVERSRLDRLTATNMTASWLNVPRVTQFDNADITELDDFLDGMKAEAQKRDVRLTLLAFLVKASAIALSRNPSFNASLSGDGQQLIVKKYVHIGVAVDTPAGLVVPVVRNADSKGIWELAAEIAHLASRAKERKLQPGEMQGACFTVSSLGRIGGRGFTPIVNAPELAILGVGKASVQPQWNGSSFEPRKILPLSLAYDHRAINGAEGGRFFTEIVQILNDIRRALL